MKVKYHGSDIGVDGLRNNGIYTVIEVDNFTGMLRIIDESEEDYLYSPKKPQAVCGNYKGGYFEIIEDDENGTLAGAINGHPVFTMEKSVLTDYEKIDIVATQVLEKYFEAFKELADN